MLRASLIALSRYVSNVANETEIEMFAHGFCQNGKTRELFQVPDTRPLPPWERLLFLVKNVQPIG